MSEPKFTPGPWYAHKPKESNGWYDITTTNSLSGSIAMCFSGLDRKVRANAALIAAAPEMYGELESVCLMCQRREIDVEYTSQRLHGECKKCNIGNVLKKARGEE